MRRRRLPRRLGAHLPRGRARPRHAAAAHGAPRARPLGYRRYHGIDLAQAAIDSAAPRADERTTFAAADAETYAPSGRFDVIVFNEVVYYFREPLATLQRYESALATEGAFVVSTFRSRRADAIARRLLGRYRLLEETTVSNRKGAWVVRVLARIKGNRRAP